MLITVNECMFKRNREKERFWVQKKTRGHSVQMYVPRVVEIMDGDGTEEDHKLELVLMLN